MDNNNLKMDDNNLIMDDNNLIMDNNNNKCIIIIIHYYPLFIYGLLVYLFILLF